jgi:hypothetical protein
MQYKSTYLIWNVGYFCELSKEDRTMDWNETPDTPTLKSKCILARVGLC